MLRVLLRLLLQFLPFLPYRVNLIQRLLVFALVLRIIVAAVAFWLYGSLLLPRSDFLFHLDLKLFIHLFLLLQCLCHADVLIMQCRVLL